MNSILPSRYSLIGLFVVVCACETRIFAENEPVGDCRIVNETTHSWAFHADMLYWFASEEASNIWADIITVTPDNSSSWTAPSFNLDWNYGFKIGADRRFGSDGWDVGLDWTWFRTSSTHTITAGPYDTVGAEFFGAFLGNLTEGGDSISKMTGHWSLLFNMFDLSLGRYFQISRSLGMRPFIGLKGGWIYQPIEIDYADVIKKDDAGHYSAVEHLKNNFLGIGPAGGVNAVWMIGQYRSHFFNLLGDFALATMWGKWMCSDVYDNSLGERYALGMKDSSLGALMFKGFLGIGWDVYFQGCRSHFGAKLGYEMQMWMNQFRLATFQLQRLHGDLTLQGLTLQCAFEF